jgi:hypothetical protein
MSPIEISQFRRQNTIDALKKKNHFGKIEGPSRKFRLLDHLLPPISSHEVGDIVGDKGKEEEKRIDILHMACDSAEGRAGKKEVDKKKGEGKGEECSLPQQLVSE